MVEDVAVVEVAGGPLDTTMVTLVPGATSMPAAGLVPMTSPAPVTVEDCETVDPTWNPSRVRLAEAEATLWPLTSGTLTVAGPVETLMSTSEP